MTEWQPIKTAPTNATPIRLYGFVGEFEYRGHDGLREATNIIQNGKII
jgi:hypothetical protein